MPRTTFNYEAIAGPQYPMLARLHPIFSISRDPEGDPPSPEVFCIGDEIDQNVTERVTAEELLRLADELRAIATGAQASHTANAAPLSLPGTS
jgi:hypothetical protein